MGEPSYRRATPGPACFSCRSRLSLEGLSVVFNSSSIAGAVGRSGVCLRGWHVRDGRLVMSEKHLPPPLMALRLQSTRPAARVSELGSLARTRSAFLFQRPYGASLPRQHRFGIATPRKPTQTPGAWSRGPEAAEGGSGGGAGCGFFARLSRGSGLIRTFRSRSPSIFGGESAWP